MRKFVVLVILLLGMASFSLGQNKQLQIMSYNVRHCAGMDLVVDYDRTAAVIFQQQPDVVALQELDSMTGRSGHCDQLGELALLTGYHPVFGAAIDFDGGKYGVGILSHEIPLSTRRIPLPGEEPRVLLVVELEDYVIACTHLDLEEAQRLASVPLIVEEAQRWQKPFLLVGDWNAPSSLAKRPPTLPTCRQSASTMSPYSTAAPRPSNRMSSMSQRPPTIGLWWFGCGCGELLSCGG